MTRNAVDRLNEKIEIVGECWVWTAGTNNKGYGKFWWKGREWKAHRAAYELYLGTIPEGLEIDHLCRNRACVNPLHLEPVTRPENMRRMRPTFCKRGHEMSEENRYARPDGKGGNCRKCIEIRFTDEAYKERRNRRDRERYRRNKVSRQSAASL